VRTNKAKEITIEDLRSLARRAGLELPDEELQRLLAGVNRSKKQVTDLRELVAVDDEPAVIFISSIAPEK
jgi:Ca2+-binding EF-hand superfamily protein